MNTMNDRTKARFRCRAIGAFVGGVLLSQAAWAQPGQSDDAAVRGAVFDQLGGRLPAEVTLLRDGETVQTGATDRNGAYIFESLPAGRYQVVTRAAGFKPTVSEPAFVGASGSVVIDITMPIGPLAQTVVVTATAIERYESIIGSPVTVVDQTLMTELGKADVLEALRTVPGTQVTQTGGRGGTTNFFVRGGEADFNKVLIDGVPANDIGGAFDFGALSVGGVDRIEVLRTANSVLHGSDALSGVIDITTRRGRSPQPQLTYSIDGGNLDTFRHELAFGGVVDRFDYYLNFSQFDTENELPNNAYHNDTFAGRLGYAVGNATDLSVTFRRVGTDLGLPGATLFNGTSDDSSQEATLTFVGVTARSQISDRLTGTLRFASTDQNSHFLNPTPTGEPFDPFGFGANYLGDPVTIEGANGFSTTGRAILDFGGAYPSVFDSDTSRRSFYGNVDYAVSDIFDVTGGVRIEREEGISGISTSTERTNYGAFGEARASVTDRLHLVGGIGYDHNEIFGDAGTPRFSAAYYLRAPARSSTGFGDTKLTFNVGRGIKAPSVFDEQSSLVSLLGGLPGGGEIIAGTGLEGIGPERSRSLDVGVEQRMWGSRARVRAAFFDNEFSDLIQFVNNAVLPELGVPPEVALAVPFGATLNAGSYRARGLETSAEVAVMEQKLWVGGGYTYMDTEVTESFTGSALAPSMNPAFPGIAIGQFAPLVGARPFRRPTHSGSVLVRFTEGPAQIAFAGYVVGKTDDSTFLSDAFFGTSMLLPNRDLTDGYQKVDVSGSYQVHPRLRWYASLENLLDADYTAAAGFPALGRTIRTGLTVNVGGGGVR